MEHRVHTKSGRARAANTALQGTACIGTARCRLLDRKGLVGCNKNCTIRNGKGRTGRTGRSGTSDRVRTARKDKSRRARSARKARRARTESKAPEDDEGYTRDDTTENKWRSQTDTGNLLL
ncbi:hypothetical protein EVAR_15932_1 [Eumeta japonica]|uniref:Uncharacterized protein n=1 Tax=Eumeta variegata TaxID=151549 RepID=A0A4C1ULF9_EUMVA|nr:hypothetical protein EVAR_15932_1 [Eumeta japonica]